MTPPDAPIAEEGFVVTYFLTVADQARSKEFYVGILGGKVVSDADPSYIKLANSWIILNSGGGPTPDKPEVLLETPRDLNHVRSFLNLRVADIWACYAEWKAKGAVFLTFGRPNDPVLAAAGRIGVMGYGGWLWSYGISFETRYNDVQSMYTGCTADPAGTGVTATRAGADPATTAARTTRRVVSLRREPRT